MKRSALCLVDTEAQADAIVEKLEAKASPITIFPCCSPIREALAISLTKRKRRCPKVRLSEPAREVSSAARLGFWPVSVPWPSLGWVHSLLLDLSWQRSAAVPSAQWAAVSLERWSV